MQLSSSAEKRHEFNALTHPSIVSVSMLVVPLSVSFFDHA